MAGGGGNSQVLKVHPFTRSAIKNTHSKSFTLPMPVAEWYKAKVCGISLPGLRVQIPPGVRLSVFCECCVLSDRGLSERANPSSRGVVPTVVYLNVIRKTSTSGVLDPIVC